jgi:hypothetical protein
MLALIVAAGATATVLLRRNHALALAAQLDRRFAVLCLGGAGMEVVGLRVGGLVGHALIVVGLGTLLVAGWALRRWPGGWLLLFGLTLNAAAMAVYGRMPMAADVAHAAGLIYPVGTALVGNKDIVAQGWLAEWLGDRFILELPIIHYTSVWSFGDMLLLSGIGRAAIGKVHHVERG